MKKRHLLRYAQSSPFDLALLGLMAVVSQALHLTLFDQPLGDAVWEGRMKKAHLLRYA